MVHALAEVSAEAILNLPDERKTRIHQTALSLTATLPEGPAGEGRADDCTALEKDHKEYALLFDPTSYLFSLISHITWK